MTTLVEHPVRLGLVVPGDCHVDDELWRLATPDAIPFITRTKGASDERMGRDAVDETTSLAEGPEIAMAAERLLDVTPAAAAYVDTSISFVRGTAGDVDISERVAAVLGCPVVVTSSAVAAGLTALGVSRMAVLSPYTSELDDRLVAYYAAHGITTASVTRMRRSYPAGTTSRELGAIEPTELVADADRIEPAGIEGLFIPCTAVRAVGAIAELERRLGVPVVTSIQATMWALLRAGGIASRRDGVGALFAIDRTPALPDRMLVRHG